MSCEVCKKGRDYMMGMCTPTCNEVCCVHCGYSRKVIHHTHDGTPIVPTLVFVRKDKYSEYVEQKKTK